MKYKRSLIILLLIVISRFGINAQNPRVKFEKLSVDEGLSQSTITSIIRDSRGFMWFSTLDGLNRYNGYEVKVYWNSPNNPNSIPDNITPVLYETPDKDKPTLWIGTSSNGLSKYNRLTDNFTNYKADKDNPKAISNNLITAIAGNNKELWIGTHKGLNKFNPQTETFSLCDKNLFTNDTISVILQDHNLMWIGSKNGLTLYNPKAESSKKWYEKDGLPGKKINAIIKTNDNRIWIAGTRGLVYTDPEKIQFTDFTHRLTKEFNIPRPNITAILEDNDSSIWIATKNKGLIKYNPVNDKLYRYEHNPFLKHSLSINSVTSLFIDQTNILWVGTSLGGVNKWNRAAEKLTVFRHNPYDENSLSASQVRSIYIDKSKNIWIGTVEGGLNKWLKDKDHFEHYMHRAFDNKSLSHNHIRSILEDDKGRFWIATDGGGLNLFDRKKGIAKAYKYSPSNPDGISNNNLWDIMQDEKGQILIATHGGGLNILNPETGKFKHFRNKQGDETSLSNDLTTLIYQDSKGFIWVGTMDGLNRWYPKEGKFLRYGHKPGKNSQLTNNRIYSMHEDTEGFLWIGTKRGLNRFNPETGKFKHFTTDNSELPNNVILGILEEGENLWMSTNRGLVRMNKKNFKIKTFNMGDGLQSNEFLAGSCCKAEDGEMFFGGIDGFNAFYPHKVKDNPHAPQVIITEFRVSNKILPTDTSISEKKKIILKHRQNDISFGFVGLDFIFPTENKYAYKLIPYDKDWNYVGTRRYASYTNLQPGKYIFCVKGANSDKVWNDEDTEIEVIIEPAFWQTLWFKILSIVALIILILGIYQHRMQTIKRRNKELEKLVKLRTIEIRQQNEEIRTQRDEIQVQNNMISKQNEEITDSIRYAEKIQFAALPQPEELNEILPEHFIFFKPRDIVSGDFFWIGKQNNKIIITAADCTGHGVPGAFMSMLGISFLNKIVNEKQITDSGHILNRLRQNIISALRQKGGKHELKEGMDMALVVIDKEKKQIQYSGAFNPLIFVRNNEDQEIKAERMPVAIYEAMEPFKSTIINYQNGDCIYLFSDGYIDQFGGPDNKKFKKKPFRNILTKISTKPMQEQKQILEDIFYKWKKDEMQIDDIIVIGIRL